MGELFTRKVRKATDFEGGYVSALAEGKTRVELIDAKVFLTHRAWLTTVKSIFFFYCNSQVSCIRVFQIGVKKGPFNACAVKTE